MVMQSEKFQWRLKIDMHLWGKGFNSRECIYLETQSSVYES